MMVSTAIILAGGLGTRLRSTVPDLPKPMAPINGRPFLEHLMDNWINQGVTHFILSVGYLSEIIREHFGEQYRNASISYAIEETPLGTGGGLLMAAYDLRESFLVLNGDTFFEVDLDKLVQYHKIRNSEWTFSLFRTTESKRYMGVDLDEEGVIRPFSMEVVQAHYLANGGVYLMNPSVLNRLSYQRGSAASLENQILPEYRASGGLVYGMECPGKFIDIGVPEDYRNAMGFIVT